MELSFRSLDNVSLGSNRWSSYWQRVSLPVPREMQLPVLGRSGHLGANPRLIGFGLDPRPVYRSRRLAAIGSYIRTTGANAGIGIGRRTAAGRDGGARARASGRVRVGVACRCRPCRHGT